MTWLLDTNVVSELRKPNCHPLVQAWIAGQSPASLFLSSITLAEIRYGIEKVTDPIFQAELQIWMTQTLRPWFAGRILAVDEEVILTWRHMVDLGRKSGYTYSQPDLFIAATAAVHHLCVVTRNIKDFQLAGVQYLDPWT